MQTEQIIIYQAGDGTTTIDVTLENETVWLTQKLMSELFEKDSDTIGLHIKNILVEGELEEKSTTEVFSVVQNEGKRNVKRNLKFYNLDMILSVGYCIFR
ncbi:RhuM family protein [Pedobacter africanus]|uniref:Virulence protein RhuM family protein n=1 Tax=Pedobacter africanus TaxID=151894 RepID=A0A1W2A4G1_9SPHI|nr:RhuM family protein [Pedobacter africanus]SMC55168.1 Virulence protein RhuM family protein [Pedobacter africanus]